jgi:zona occludens toxin
VFYLTTGANGACKTLMTLYDVRQQQLKENRPVFYDGFTPVKEIIEGQFGWKPHNPELWNQPEDQGGVPDGAILIWDECQTRMGAKKWGNREPDKWVVDLGVYRRKRGIDIWAICPHPGDIHISVRRLIASPSWHRHYVRIFGAQAANEYRFNTPNLKCEDVKDDAEARPRRFPKEVFAWYKSATLHTGKRKVPRAFWVVLACLVGVPVLGYFAWHSLRSSVDPAAQAKHAASSGSAASPGAPGAARGDQQKAPMTAAEYVASRQARVPGMPFTAPAYDDVTKPTVAPYPAACIYHHKGGQCDCYTQQATKLVVPQAVCEQIARNGIFVDWQQPVVSAAAAPAAAGASDARSPGDGVKLDPVVRGTAGTGQPLRVLGQTVGQWR